MSTGEDFHDAVPRCPRCLEHVEVERSGNFTRRWYCRVCDLVFAGTAEEHAGESRKRADDAERDRLRAEHLGTVS